MGKFKQFLHNEDVGLADLGPRIEKMYGDGKFNTRLNNAVVSSQWTGSHQPTILGDAGDFSERNPRDIIIPSVEKTGVITHLYRTKNPIYIRLSDGTELKMTYDQFNKIKGTEPKVGKTMTVSFQRNPNDTSQNHSKIEKAIVRD